MTKTAFRCVQIVLLFYGVFGADEDEVKAVSVMEGDSVTLNPDLTQIKKFNLIEWKFGDPIIAKTDGNYILYPNHTEIFRGRLQLDQTGSLTIKNMKTKHSGLYQLQISHDAGTAERKFSVTVYESPSDPGKAEMKSVSVMSGDRVTLQTGVTLISGEELIVWRFGDEGKLIAKADKEAKSSPLYYDGRFRDRLELDQTGSLTITDTRSTDSGFYSVKISSRTQTVYKRLSVSVSEPGLSPGDVAGIVVAVLLVLAAAAVGFIYYRRKISELQKQILKRVSVTEGDSVHLFTDRPKIERDDVIEWRFGDEIIAEIKEGTGETHDGADGRFRDRLQLNDRTGDLTIKNFTDEDAGDYNLKIRSRKGNTNKTYLVIIRVTVPVTGTEGEDIILKPNKTIQKGDGILWQFGEGEQLTSIAKFIRETGEIVKYDYAADGRFRDRLKLDTTTGSLTIRNSRTEHSGLYTLYITSSTGDSQQRFIVTINERVEEKSVEEGGTVTLKPDTEIQEDDQILWIFGEEYVLITEIRDIYDDVLGGRFRGRLKLEKKTGSLTITDIKPEHIGLYKLQISSSRRTLCKRFRVSIPWRWVSVTVGDSVHLSTDRHKIERDDEIQWMFGGEIIAEIKGGTGKTHDGADERFRDRLQLDKITGDLTIKNCAAEDAGYYNLKISSRKGNTNWTYSVTITVRHVYVIEGESVHLSTGRPKIERGDVIQWRCGDENSLIALIKEGTGETHDGAAGRFRDRLQLNDQTGDLTIKSFTAEDAGDYKLNIRSSNGNRNRTYRVGVRGRRVYVTEGESVHLSTGRPKIERDAAVTDAVKPREKSPVKGNNDESVVEMQPLMIK